MPDLNIIPKKQFDAFKGEQLGNVKYVQAGNVDKNYVPAGKSSNQSKLSKIDYMQDKINRFPGMSASEVNNHFGSNVIGEKSFDEYNTLAGLNKAVTYEETGKVNRETETNITSGGASSTGGIPEKEPEKEWTYEVTGGETKVIDGDKSEVKPKNKRSFKRNRRRFDSNEVESKTGVFCDPSSDHDCNMDVAKLQGASDKADDKAYNKAQKDRSYKVNKDGTQVLKKEFAPGQWFSEKMETHKINKAQSQGQGDRKKKQRVLDRERKKRNKVTAREHQHNNPKNYNKVSNFFNELSYKKDKPKGSRTIKASF